MLMKKTDSKEDMKMDMAQDKAMIKKAFGMHDKQLHENKRTDLSKLKQGGSTMKRKMMNPAMALMAAKALGAPAPAVANPMAAMAPPAGAPVPGMKKGGKTMAKETMGPKTMSKDVESGSNKLGKFGQSKVQKRGLTRGMNLGDTGPTEGIMGGGMKKGGKAKCMAMGGSASSRADGIASKGKTKGKWC